MTSKISLLILALFWVAALIFILKPELVTKVSPKFSPQNIEVNIPEMPPVSLNTIFNQDHAWVSTISAQKKVTLVATGDVIPARSVNYQATQRNNFKWSFENTADLLKSADLTLINLESPLVQNCPVTQEGMTFCGSEKHLEGLKFAGIDIASLANNHSGNYGQKGTDSTVALLNQAEILTTGLGQPVYKEINGVKFAFLGWSDLGHEGEDLNSPYATDIKNQIQEAKKVADIVVVSMHWGAEYQTQPGLRQKDLAHFEINSGADLIIGNHPHWVQPVEIYQGKLITYAHGNFVFDQMWSEKTKEGVVGKYTFIDKQLIDVEFLPVKIKDYGQPSFLEGAEKQRILNEMKKASQNLAQFTD